MYNFVYTNVQDGDSPLIAASEDGHTDVVDLLIRAGADVNLAPEVILTVQNTLRLLLIAGTNFRMFAGINFRTCVHRAEPLCFVCMRSTCDEWTQL